MRRRKKNLSYVFWGLAFLAFTFGFGWHLSQRYFPKENPINFSLGNPSGVSEVIETKEPSKEEVHPLPVISKEELEFRERANTVLDAFPSKEILSKKDRDFHGPPEELGEAAAELGAIEDLLDKSPTLTNEGLRFYRKCALKESLLTPVRALCLHNLKIRAKSSGIDKKIRWNEFPENLHRIADRL